MRHKKRKQRLNRFTSWRKSTLIAIAKSLLIKQRVVTTKTKAKAARRLAEKLVSLAKKNNLAAMRKAYSVIQDHRLVAMLFKQIAPRFEKRNSGFTRIIPLGRRRGDKGRNGPSKIAGQRWRVKN